MKKYFSMFRIRFSNSLQYRSAALAGIATQFAWGFMLLMMYRAFYESGSAMPMSFPELASYLWLQQGFLAVLNFWNYDTEPFSMISDGNVAYELLRPVGVYNMWFVKNMASRLARVSLRCVPVLLVASLLPAPFCLSAPQSPQAFLVFLLSLVMGMVLTLSLIMLLYISAFHTLNPMGVRIVVMALAEFLAGGVVPLPFFPDGFRQLAEFSPFGGASNLPFRIYSGNLQGSEMWMMILVQLLWIVLIGILGRTWMKISLKNVVVQGG